MHGLQACVITVTASVPLTCSKVSIWHSTVELVKSLSTAAASCCARLLLSAAIRFCGGRRAVTNFYLESYGPELADLEAQVGLPV
jgi:hypothetical protein